MKCGNDKAMITSWLNNEMTAAERALFEQHLAGCPECSAELEATQRVWMMLEEMPSPAASDNMPVRFQAMLESYKESQQKSGSAWGSLVEKIKTIWTAQPGMQLAFSVTVLIVGVAFGWIISNQGASHKEIASLSSQVKEMKEMMMLSLLENPSASERIRGVSYTSEIKKANSEVIEALLATLNNDPNVNVRLVTLEALMQYATESAVREGLVKSISKQESPLVQSALADAMLKLQEKKSVPSFRELLQQKDLNDAVRNKIRQTITELI